MDGQGARKLDSLQEAFMNLIFRRSAILALAVLAAACGDDCAYDSGLFGESMTPPLPTLDGIWEGREAPFTTKDTYPWWQFDVEHDGSSGTFVTDRSFHQGPHGDTVRGRFRGYYCFRRDEVDWQFELRYRAYTTQCTFSGKVSGGDRIDGLLGCAFADSGGKYWKALYLIHERARN